MIIPVETNLLRDAAVKIWLRAPDALPQGKLIPCWALLSSLPRAPEGNLFMSTATFSSSCWVNSGDPRFEEPCKKAKKVGTDFVIPMISNEKALKSGDKLVLDTRM